MTQRDYCMDCPPGFYCVDGETTLRCPKGHYCPGATNATQPKCPVGTYNEYLGTINALILLNILMKLVFVDIF